MKPLSPKLHGVLDYVVVAVFALAPSLLHLSRVPALLSWTLAVVHLLVTVITAFPCGLVKLLPLKIHGWIELAVAPTLVAVPWVLGFAADATARGFYVAAGVVIFATWCLTDYKAA
jgi:hypothetical protein